MLIAKWTRKVPVLDSDACMLISRRNDASYHRFKSLASLSICWCNKLKNTAVNLVLGIVDRGLYCTEYWNKLMVCLGLFIGKVVVYK